MGSLLQAPVSESVGNVGNRSLAFGSNVTAGSTLVVVAQAWRSGGWDPVVSDDQANEWHVAAEPTFDNFKVFVAYAYDVAPGATEVTIACSSASYYAWVIYEIPGAEGLDPKDLVLTGSETGGTTHNVGPTGFLSQGDEIAFAVVAVAQGGDEASISVDSGFTETLEELDNDTHQAGEIDYKELSSNASIDLTWTFGDSKNALWALVTFNTNTYSAGVLNFGGFEHGDKAWAGGEHTIDAEIVEASAGVAAARLTFNTEGRTGQGGMLFDDSAGTFGKAGIFIRQPDGTDFPVSVAASVWLTFYFKVLTGSEEGNVFVVMGGISLKWNVLEAAIYLEGSTPSDTGYPVVDTDWHKIELHYRRNFGNSELSELYVDDVFVDNGIAHGGGGGEFDVVLNGNAGYGWGYHGVCAYDDWVISRKRLDFDPQVVVMAPDGNGNYTAWTGTEADVDDLDGAGAEDLDSTYINSSTSGQAETVTLEASSVASDGVGAFGTIKAVKSQALIRDEGGAASVAVRLRSGSTDDDTASADPGSSYVSRGKVYSADVDGATPWNSTLLDALEVGVVNNAAVAARCTALALMVLTDGVNPVAREQEGYRWRDDDGDENSASWLASQDADISRDKLTPTRLRILTDVTSDAPSEGLKLQYRRVGDTDWRDVH